MRDCTRKELLFNLYKEQTVSCLEALTLKKISTSSMASISAIQYFCPPSSSSNSITSSLVSFARFPESDRRTGGHYRRLFCNAMVQQTSPGAPSTFAKEMERLSAKESLLLAFKDSGGFEALVAGNTTDMQRIDVNERITGLERLNPTPRPTTSPFLEGRWNFEWFGSGSPGLFSPKFIFERFPTSLANFSKMDVYIKDGYAKVSANLKFLTMARVDSITLFFSASVNYEMQIEVNFILSSRLSVEGPLRMKEEYVEGILGIPTVIEETIPEQLKGALGQAANTMQQLPVPIQDALANGLKVSLSGTFQRLFMISYLDDQILIIRDIAGVPEVLTRLDSPSSPLEESIMEYES